MPISELRICYNCINMVWPERLTASWEVVGGGEVCFPVCVNHAYSPGVPREVHPASTCANFRGKPQPALRVVPPEPERPNDKYIPLTRGLWAIVDAADFERLSKYRWYATPSGGGKTYARRNTKTGTVLMHREILQFFTGPDLSKSQGEGVRTARGDSFALRTYTIRRHSTMLASGEYGQLRKKNLLSGPMPPFRMVREAFEL